MDLLDISVTCTACREMFKVRHELSKMFSIACPKCKLEIVSAICYRGFLYILSNPSMPGLVKIGLTERDPYQRALELWGPTGVPERFYVEAFFVSDDPRRDEATLHALLDEHRVSGDREFFRLEVQKAIDALTNALRRRPAVINDGTNPPLRADFDDSYPDPKLKAQAQPSPPTNPRTSGKNGPDLFYAFPPFPLEELSPPASVQTQELSPRTLHVGLRDFLQRLPPTRPPSWFECVLCHKQFPNEPPPPRRCPSCNGAICST